MKRIMTVLLCCAVLLSLWAGVAAAENTPVYIEPAEAFAGGSGTADDPFRIETAQQLALLAKVINQNYDWEHLDERDLYKNGYYALTADIALNDTSNFANWETEAPAYVWEPIGIRSESNSSSYYDFRGAFDGQGHTISGLYCLSELLYDREDTAGGLFGQVMDAQIRNVNITDSMLKAADKQEAGLLVGSGTGSVIENCHVSGRVMLDHVHSGGGVVGYMFGDGLKDCSFSGSITAENTSDYVGGVCGSLSCTGEGLVNYASIEVRNSPILAACGGVVGSVSECALRNSRNVGSVTVLGEADDVGGVCGVCSSGFSLEKDENGKTVSVAADAEISGCVNSGDVTAKEATSVGGVIGDAFNCFLPTGQITIQGCANEGNVAGLENAGGIAGRIFLEYASYRMQQCVNRGSVTGTGRAGGIAGSANTAKGASVIEGCENQGNVSSDSCAGGILGWGVDPNLAWKDGDAGSLTIAKCRNSGNVSVASGTAGGILSRLMNGGYDYIIEITQCENTGVIHSDGIGRLGGVLGGCTAGYVFGLEEKAACYIRSCVNSGVLSYGDATVNVADYTAGETDDGRALNATEKAVIAMGGSAVGGMVGASFGTVVESCLNRGLVMLPAGTVPISDIEANVRLTDEDSVAFVGGIYGLSLCGSSDASKNERVTDCAYTDSFTAAVYAPFLPADSETVAGNRQVTAEEADALAAELLH